jgi:hypothetical protein
MGNAVGTSFFDRINRMDRMGKMNKSSGCMWVLV